MKIAGIPTLTLLFIIIIIINNTLQHTQSSYMRQTGQESTNPFAASLWLLLQSATNGCLFSSSAPAYFISVTDLSFTYSIRMLMHQDLLFIVSSAMRCLGNHWVSFVRKRTGPQKSGFVINGNYSSFSINLEEMKSYQRPGIKHKWGI